MKLVITGSVPSDAKKTRYVSKTVAAIARALPKTDRSQAEFAVILDHIDQPHGNKYQATIVIKTASGAYRATDSTLNVFAALDIVRFSLVRQLQKLTG